MQHESFAVTAGLEGAVVRSQELTVHGLTYANNHACIEAGQEEL